MVVMTHDGGGSAGGSTSAAIPGDDYGDTCMVMMYDSGGTGDDDGDA